MPTFASKDAALAGASVSINRRWLFYGIWILACVALFRAPLHSLVDLAVHSEDASHILLIPFISGYLLFLDRKLWSPGNSVSYRAALPFLLGGALIALSVMLGPTWDASWKLALGALSVALCLLAGFIAIFGTRAAQISWFAWAFLLFAVPVPPVLLNRFIYVLQAGSAAVAGWLFDLSGAPVLREGFTFYFPRISIEVAQECSGIRSSMALLVLAVLVAHFAFRPFWKKAIFLCAGLLVMIVKNGVRIATLTLLANYVNPDFLYGRLHREGGVVFFLLGLMLLLPVYWLLRRRESSRVPQSAP